MATILSIVPYRFLPPTNGGHWGVYIVEKTLAIFNTVHTLATKDNEPKKETEFTTHFLLTSGKTKYVPFAQATLIRQLAEEVRASHIFCHHHYMFFSAKKAAQALNLPLFIRCHNIESQRFKSTGKWWWKIMYYFEKMAFRKSDHIMFVTAEDKAWAIKHYGIKEQKCTVMPFGIDFANAPVKESVSKVSLGTQFNLDPEAHWLFFMGQLDYGPNAEAVELIIDEIAPRLSKAGLRYEMLICGKNLPDSLLQKINREPNLKMHYLGFVPDIEAVIQASDIMLNPVLGGGGVKTKVVESLAWRKTVVSTESGAQGIEPSVCGDKLRICQDNDWDEFCRIVAGSIASARTPIPSAFFEYYYSGKIAERIQAVFGAK